MRICWTDGDTIPDHGHGLVQHYSRVLCHVHRQCCSFSQLTATAFHAVEVLNAFLLSLSLSLSLCACVCVCVCVARHIQYISVIVPTLGPPKNGHYKQ